MPKCDFNKVATSAWVFSCKFVAYFQNSFFYEHLWVAASDFKMKILIFLVLIFLNLKHTQSTTTVKQIFQFCLDATYLLNASVQTCKPI